MLDGDNIRHGLSSDLGFEPQDAHENIRRIGEVAKLFVDAGVIVLCAFVSPYRDDRARLRATLGAGDFVEIYVKASLEACRAAGPQGLVRESASRRDHRPDRGRLAVRSAGASGAMLDTETHSPAASLARYSSIWNSAATCRADERRCRR